MSNKIKNVLFICFGNTARSPAAEGIAKALKRDKYSEELKNVDFDSAGFFNVYKTAQPETKKYLKEHWNIDFSDFKGKIMDENLLKNQDLILAMQSRHLKRLRRKFKNINGLMERAYLLLDYAEEEGEHDIEDPVNLSVEEYEHLISIVEQGVIKSVQRIIKTNLDKN
ncbi:MAG: hypothetical protein GF317_11520 [Candidatus Lokiarchaeota archaeon]|nr:hypothetical protein [Candidatus Lokiarchaeota archaeon]MBD3200280.1 hypothetical protein [Candidatus Lokiarchaeota archaeon]